MCVLILTNFVVLTSRSLSVFRNCSGLRVSLYASVFVPSSPDVITVSSLSSGCMVVTSFASASGRGLTWLPRQ